MDKEERLKSTHTFNPNYDKINDPTFASSDVLDTRDLLQVRYEMVRSVRIDKDSPKDVASRFGVSEATLRRHIRDLRDGGMIALVPDIRGPKGQHSLNDEEIQYIESYLVKHPDASGGQVHSALVQEKQSEVSKRTIERYLASKKENGNRK